MTATERKREVELANLSKMELAVREADMGISKALRTKEVAEAQVRAQVRVIQVLEDQIKQERKGLK